MSSQFGLKYAYDNLFESDSQRSALSLQASLVFKVVFGGFGIALFTP